jgi:hypothetical protein
MAEGHELRGAGEAAVREGGAACGASETRPRAGREAGEQRRLLFLAACGEHRLHGEYGSFEEGNGRKDAAGFFQDQRHFDRAQAKAAKAFRDHQPGKAHFAKARPQAFIKACGPFDGGADDVGIGSVGQEVAGRFLDRALIVAEREIHQAAP